VREMRTAVIRTAFSPMIHEGHDFSCAIMTPAGELVAASEVDQPTHLSSLPWSTRTVLKRYGDNLAEGDLFLFNHGAGQPVRHGDRDLPGRHPHPDGAHLPAATFTRQKFSTSSLPMCANRRIAVGICDRWKGLACWRPESCKRLPHVVAPTSSVK
jgi:hypothetical protein